MCKEREHQTNGKPNVVFHSFSPLFQRTNPVPQVLLISHRTNPNSEVTAAWLCWEVDVITHLMFVGISKYMLTTNIRTMNEMVASSHHREFLLELLS
jgi:hypothetical protein